MSAATELDWDWASYPAPDHIPGRRGSAGRGSAGTLATVTALHRPPEQAVAPQLRLTRRGVHVVAAAVAVLAVALVALARVSAPSADRGTSTVLPATVTVRAGDTLWSIAGRIAPEGDPTAEIAQLQRLNHLHGVALVPGQVLRTR
jgi:nucleoid-associated protein YgaU